MYIIVSARAYDLAKLKTILNAQYAPRSVYSTLQN